MARKNQKLINYNTSGTSASKPISAQTSYVEYGEIVVRYATEEPRLYIKKADNSFAEFVDKSSTTIMINSAITNVSTNVGALETKINNLSGSVEAFSGYVVNNYAKKEEVAGELSAITEEINSLNAFSGFVVTNYATSADTVNYINTVSGDIASTISGLDTRITDNTTSITNLNTFSGKVVNEYATKEYVETVSGRIESTINAVDAKITGETTGLIARVNSLSGAIYDDGGIIDKLTDAESSITVNATNISTNATKINTVSGQVIALSAGTVALSGSIVSYVDTKLSAVYVYKDSVANYSDLPTSGNKTGDVYNVVNANGTPGQTGYTPAGTNYAWNGSAWDALGGTVDLSNYTTTATTKGIADRVADNEADITELNAFSGKVANEFATKAYVNQVSGDIKTTIDGLSVATTGLSQKLNNLSASVVSISGAIYTEGGLKGQIEKNSEDISELSESLGTVEENLGTLSSSVETFSGKVFADYATKTYADGKASAAESNANTYTDGKVADINAAIGVQSGRIDTLVNDVSQISSDVAALSSATIYIEATANDALQDAEFATISETVARTDVNSGAKVIKDGTTLKLDLSNLVIDCGEF